MIAPDPIPLALAIGFAALLAITAAIVTALHVSGAWRKAREADQRAAAGREAELLQDVERKRVTIEFYAAESARMRAVKSKQSRRQHDAVLRRSMTQILRQDVGR